MSKLLLKDVRFSYVRVFEPQQFNGAGEKFYSVTIIIPKDSKSAEVIKKAVKEEVANMIARFPKLKGKMPAAEMFHNPLRDGDSEDKGAELEGSYFINAKRAEDKGQPLVIDRRKQHITVKEEMYSGSWGAVSINLYSYEFAGKYGIGVGLNGIQKTDDGERLDGGATTADFDMCDEEEADPLFD